MNIAQVDPRGYIRILWRWKLLFVAFLIGVPAVVYAVVSRETKVYQASVLLQEDALPVDTALVTQGGAAAPSSQPNAETLGGQARVIETPAVARLAATHLHPRPSNPSTLLGNISATGDQNTGFITVTAEASNARLAANIANAFGAAVVTLRTQQATGLTTTAIDQLSVQLDHLGRHYVGRSQLSSQIQSLRALRATQGTNAQILQAAVPNPTPISPKTRKTVILSGVLGLLLAIGAVLLAEAADRRIRHPEDLEELTERPLLAVVPRGAFSGEKLSRLEQESFHMLRSALMFFNVDRQLSTVLVTSPVKGDGKTTVATHLAIAAAQGGHNVILVDADMRRPQAAARLHITGEATQPGHGLAGVLSGQCSLAEALVDVAIGAGDDNDAAPPELQGRLRLLPAGGVPPNPSELLSSLRMPALLEELEGLADFVVIDTTPLLSVSDALPLFDAVSGVVLVARLHSTTRDAIRRFQKTVGNTNATVLGVVATGAASGGFYGRYGYGYGYGYYGYGSTAYANGNGTRGAGRFPRRRRREKQTS